MSHTDNFDDSMDNENFEELLKHSLNRKDFFSIGDHVTGTVIFVTNENVFVDIAGKSEAVIAAGEFMDNKGVKTVKKGDTVEGYVVSVSGGEIHVTTAIGKGQASPELIRIAYANDIPVNGTITDVTKGGYGVSVSGVRCFCPFSQIDIKKIPVPEELISKNYLFKITEYAEKGRNIILSRKVLLEVERKKTEDNLQKTLKLGDDVQGIISSIQDFGVFVNIGGMEALIPRSELSWSRNVDKSAYQPGQRVTARVKSIDWESKRISLSLKDLITEPWKVVNYEVGSTRNGKVVNFIKSGAFIELEPGIEGFIHISNMSFTKRINKPEDVLTMGAVINVKILNIDKANKKISLELITGEADPWTSSSKEFMEGVHTGIIEISKTSGINVRLQNGMLGFIPRGQLVSGNKDIPKEYTVGKEIKVTVVDLNAQEKNLILSEMGAIKNEELSDYRQFQEKNTPSSSSSLGSLLKNKFDKIQKDMEDKTTE